MEYCMNNHEKVFILMVDDKIESLWYNEENIREEYQNFLEDGYTEDQIYVKTCYINDFNE